MSTKKGFTLLEILLAVGAISILAAVVIVAINPGKQLATARNTTRLIDVHTIADAIYQYTLDHDGQTPATFVSSTYTMLGTSGSGCGTTCAGAVDNSSWNSNQTFGDQSANDFNAGSLNNVTYDNTNSGLKLSSGTSGDFTSRVFDSASAGTSWSTLTWAPSFPTYKELPNNGGSETGYPSGNVNMTGNTGLWHLNEASGTSFADASGNNLTGTCPTGRCPTLATAGKFGLAPTFNMTNKQLINLGNTLNDVAMKYTMTAEGWFKVGSAPTSIRAIISKAQFSVDNRMFLLGIWGGTGGCNFDFAVHDDNNNVYHLMKSDLVTVDNQWHYLTGTWNNGVQILYYDGVPVASSTRTFTKLNDSSGVVLIGSGDSGTSWFWDGTLDEVAVYNRALSAAEIKDHYNRGAARLKLQVRACADSYCNGKSFVGSDGTANTFYSELSNATLSLPSISLSASSTQYFQYKTFFESDKSGLSPLLKTVSAAANVPPPVGASDGSTTDVCLDLSSTLVNGGYISAVPFDPKLGSAANTFYAVKAADHGKIMVKSCRAELGQDISTMR